MKLVPVSNMSESFALVVDMEEYPDYKPLTTDRVVGVYHPLQDLHVRMKPWTVYRSKEVLATLIAITAAMNEAYSLPVRVLTSEARFASILTAISPLGISITKA